MKEWKIADRCYTKCHTFIERLQNPLRRCNYVIVNVPRWWRKKDTLRRRWYCINQSNLRFCRMHDRNFLIFFVVLYSEKITEKIKENFLCRDEKIENRKFARQVRFYQYIVYRWYRLYIHIYTHKYIYVSTFLFAIVRRRENI